MPITPMTCPECGADLGDDVYADYRRHPGACRACYARREEEWNEQRREMFGWEPWPIEEPRYERRCWCGRRYLYRWREPWGPVYCGPECVRLARNERRRNPRAAHTLTCERCGKTFTAKRRDARLCSGACRVAAHRSRIVSRRT